MHGHTILPCYILITTPLPVYIIFFTPLPTIAELFQIIDLSLCQCLMKMEYYFVIFIRAIDMMMKLFAHQILASPLCLSFRIVVHACNTRSSPFATKHQNVC